MQVQGAGYRGLRKQPGRAQPPTGTRTFWLLTPTKTKRDGAQEAKKSGLQARGVGAARHRAPKTPPPNPGPPARPTAQPPPNHRPTTTLPQVYKATWRGSVVAVKSMLLPAAASMKVGLCFTLFV